MISNICNNSSFEEACTLNLLKNLNMFIYAIICLFLTDDTDMTNPYLVSYDDISFNIRYVILHTDISPVSDI